LRVPGWKGCCYTGIQQTAALNGKARNLALAEFADADGAWHKAWEGKLPAAARGFEQVWYTQQLGQKQAVRALHLTFRSASEAIDVNHAALLQAGATDAPNG
jgi:hypothetical protein